MGGCLGYGWILVDQRETYKRSETKIMEDHQWHLRSYDHNFVGVLKYTMWSVVKSLDPIFFKCNLISNIYI